MASVFKKIPKEMSSSSYTPTVSFPSFSFLLAFYLITEDVKNGETKLLTDGKSKNENLVWAHSGDKFIYTTTQVLYCYLF